MLEGGQDVDVSNWQQKVASKNAFVKWIILSGYIEVDENEKQAPFLVLCNYLLYLDRAKDVATFLYLQNQNR